MMTLAFDMSIQESIEALPISFFRITRSSIDAAPSHRAGQKGYHPPDRLAWKHDIGKGRSWPGDIVSTDEVPTPRDRRLSGGWAFWLFIGLILTNIFWGASGVAVKVALDQLDIFEIVAYRFTAAAVILLLVTLIWKGRKALSVKRRDLPLLALLAFLGIPLEFLLQVLSLANTSVTNFTLIFCLAPFFIIFGSSLLTKEKVTQNKVLGTLLAFAGVAFVVLSAGTGLTSNLLGDGMALLSCVIWSVYTVAGKPINQRYTTLTVLNYVFIFGALEMLPLLLIPP